VTFPRLHLLAAIFLSSNESASLFLFEVLSLLSSHGDFSLLFRCQRCVVSRIHNSCSCTSYFIQFSLFYIAQYHTFASLGLTTCTQTTSLTFDLTLDQETFFLENSVGKLQDYSSRCTAMSNNFYKNQIQKKVTNKTVRKIDLFCNLTLKTPTEEFNSVYFIKPNIANYKLPSEGFTICTHTTSLTFDLTSDQVKLPQKIEKKPSQG